jgi:hypothetical protein
MVHQESVLFKDTVNAQQQVPPASKLMWMSAFFQEFMDKASETQWANASTDSSLYPLTAQERSQIKI